ncbi:molecular chaperone [Serratia marcescens]|uniref:fimbrial biogenesis chaperone n=1 Tax=Serratia marcescens TaxID=615 RepID=UPI001EF005AE|nr:molecular chaperone [Serratia marcescens]ULH10503.1 molecular chaperone [Serratia marcescens]
MALYNKTGRAGTVVTVLVGGLTTMLMSMSVQAAGIGLGAVRLIYDQKAGQVTLPVRNTSSTPYLVSSRVALTPDSHESTPFIVSPPLFRLEGNGQGMLRIIGNPQSLPPDRESVFYVTVAGIPSSNPLSRDDKQGFDVAGGLKFAFGNTIKLFYRPTGLPSSATEAAKGVRFTHVGNSVKVENPSAYYVTFQTLTLNGHTVKFSKTQPDMLTPFGSMTLPAGRAFPISQAGKVSWAAVVDMGNLVSANGVIQ